MILELLPVWAMALVVAGAMTALGAASVWLVELVVPRTRRPPNNDLAGFILAVAGAVYAVPLGLIVAEAWEDFADARRAVQLEAAHIARVAALTPTLPRATATAIRSELAAYARAVIDEEWPAMARGETPSEADPHLGAIRSLVDGEILQSPTRDPRLERAASHIDDLVHVRIDRLLASRQALIGPVWALIWIGAVITLVFCSLFAAEQRGLHALLSGMMGLVISLVIILILCTDRPFYGSARLLPDPIETVLQGRWLQ